MGYSDDKIPGQDFKYVFIATILSLNIIKRRYIHIISGYPSRQHVR